MNEIILTTPDQLEQVVMQALKKVLPAVEKEKSAEPPDSCSFNQALTFLSENGYVISKSALYKLTALKKIPFKRFGRKIIFSRKELLQWVESLTMPNSGTSNVLLNLAESARRKSGK
jgi:excisionase family DNA binding protein